MDEFDIAELNLAIAQVSMVMDEVNLELIRLDDLKSRVGTALSRLIAVDRDVKLLHNNLQTIREKVTQQSNVPLTVKTEHVIVTQQSRKVKEEDI